ncbi:MAG: hypothetical protein GY870_12350, partial [archaeon]|nr:hypothetical protein [archaeon]
MKIISKLKNKRRISFNSIIILFIFTLINSGIILTQSAAVIHEETDLIKIDLIGREFVWEYKDCRGEYYNLVGIHYNTKIAYNVSNADVNQNLYYVNVSESNWTKEGLPDDFTYGSIMAEESDYFLITRSWSDQADSFVEEYADEFGYNEVGLSQEFLNITYTNEWIQGQLINLVVIRIYIDENNFDISKYTRGEGIMVSRHAKVDLPGAADDGTDKSGELHIELISFDEPLLISFWSYIIWFLAILGIFFISI